MATPAFNEYGVPQLYGCHGNIHEILLKITANLIDKICYYTSRMNEPSLNDSKKKKNCDFQHFLNAY